MEDRVYIIHGYKKKLDLMHRIRQAALDFMYSHDATTGEAAKRVGISRPTLDNILHFDANDIECLRVIPHMRTLVKVARYLNVEV